MTQAGDLRERVILSQEILVNPDAPKDYGNTTSEWQEQFSLSAEYIHVRGGETVMENRLQGKHVQIVRVRATAESRQIKANWLLTDARTLTQFNVRDVTPLPDRMWIDLLCESGVAT